MQAGDLVRLVSVSEYWNIGPGTNYTHLPIFLGYIGRVRNAGTQLADVDFYSEVTGGITYQLYLHDLEIV